MQSLEYRIRSLFLKIDQRDYLFSKILNFIYKFFNFNKYFNSFRNRDLKLIKDPELAEKGFKQIKPQNIILDKVLFRSKEIINSTDYNKNLGGKKEFLKSYQINLFKNENHIFYKFLFEENIINEVIGYLGKNITLAGATILYSDNKSFEFGRSQNMHMDGEGLKQIKIFCYISDVDENSGPLTVLSKKDSKILYNKVDKNTFIKKKTIKIEDKVLEKFSMRERIYPLLGKEGTINFVDTSNCYHFGSRPGKYPRYVLMYQFLNSFSYYLPMIKKMNSFIKESQILDKDEVKIVNKLIRYKET